MKEPENVGDLKKLLEKYDDRDVISNELLDEDGEPAGRCPTYLDDAYTHRLEDGTVVKEICFCAKPEDVGSTPQEMEFCLSNNYELEDYEIIMYAQPIGRYNERNELSDEVTEGDWGAQLEETLHIDIDTDYYRCGSTYLLCCRDKSTLTVEQWKENLIGAGMVFNQQLQDFVNKCKK